MIIDLQPKKASMIAEYYKLSFIILNGHYMHICPDKTHIAKRKATPLEVLMWKALEHEYLKREK